MGGVGISRLFAAKGMGSKGGVGTNMWGGGGCQGLDGVGDGEEGIHAHLLLRKLAPLSVQFENSLKLERSLE